jgi:hypothetical protein
MLQSLPLIHPPLKLFRYSEVCSTTSTEEDFIPRKAKIYPMPILYTKFQNTPTLREKIVIHGHKYLSKLSASGPGTSQVLKGIKKSQSLKFAPSFEYDPYLCDESYLDLLSKALMKLKHTKDLNLVIRRLDKSDELSKLTKQVKRLLKLYKLRLEAPRTKNMNDQALIEMGKMIGQCYSIQVLDHVTLNLEGITESAHLNCSKNGKRLIRLRHIKRAVQKTEIVENMCIDLKKVQPSIFRRVKIKTFDFNFGMPTGWLSMSTDLDSTSMLFLKALAWHQDLQSIRLRFTGNPAVLETMQVLSETVPKIKTLKRFSLEFLNSRITESEIFTVLQMIPQLTHIEEFTFKVLQYPNIEEACILCLTARLAKYPNFKKINLYFRRLALDDYAMEEMVNQIQSLNDIKCVEGKKSLYISRGMDAQSETSF